MAVAPTGAIYKALEFDNVSSRTYGVYITGEAVYNAPKRDVEMITIPGRNGTFALDNGRFENIEVSYPAGIYADTEADFRQAISDFRNFLCSRKGYVRLQDEYNPDEYRMAVYKSGLDVDPALLRAGEFKITFDCKPQRWLTSGETAVTVTSGDTLTNPTLFESGPLLEVGGSGSIQFNGYEISFEGIPYGEVVIGEKGTYSLSSPATVTLDTSLLNVGDPIYPEIKECAITAYLRTLNLDTRITDVRVSSTTANVLEATFVTGRQEGHSGVFMRMLFYPDFGAGFVYGTAATINCIADYIYRVNSGATGYHERIEITIDYDGADTYTVTASRPSTLPTNVYQGTTTMESPTMHGNSSQPNPAPIFIDCDLGEAYTNESGVYRSLNSYIDLGSELPKLGVGENEITFDNTIVNFTITPRWWKV